MEDIDKNSLASVSEESIKNKIYTIRGVQVMLDSDLAEIYGYETKNFNRQVKNNIERFGEDFMFQLTSLEIEQISRCKNFTSIMQAKGMKGGRVYLPYAFTEQGIYMLMTILKGELAVSQSKMLIRLFKHLERIDNKLVEHDKQFEKILEDLTDPAVKKSALFFQGQMFDAFSLLVKIIKEAKESIILIDNYIDTATLDIISKKDNKEIKVKLVSLNFNLLTDQDIKTFKEQYCPSFELVKSKEFHDRFLILDELRLYHIGASLKDAGKKCFEISLIDDEKQVKELLKRIE